MIYPTAEQISKLTGDRYLITVATAKCARMVTDEYVEQRAAAERLIAKKEADKPLFSMIDPDIRDDKAVKTAIRRLMSGEYKILTPEEAAARRLAGESEQTDGGEKAEAAPEQASQQASPADEAAPAEAAGEAEQQASQRLRLRTRQQPGEAAGEAAAAGCAAGFACERAGNGGSGGRPVRGRAEGVI